MKNLIALTTIVFSLLFLNSCQQAAEETPSGGQNAGEVEVLQIIAENSEGFDDILSGDDVFVEIVLSSVEAVLSVELAIEFEDGGFASVRTENNPPYEWGKPVTNQDFALNDLPGSFDLLFTINKTDGTTINVQPQKVTVAPGDGGVASLINIFVTDQNLSDEINVGDDLLIGLNTENPNIKNVDLFMFQDDQLTQLDNDLNVVPNDQSSNLLSYNATNNIQSDIELLAKANMNDGSIIDSKIFITVLPAK